MRLKACLLFLLILIISASTTETPMAAPAPAEIAKTVTFIFLADDAGNLRTQNGAPVPNGTGFFVLVENDNGPGGYGYLVTAKHVLKNEKGDFFRRVFVRINDRKGGSEFLAFDIAPSGGQQNIFVHNDRTVDIAVVPGLPDQTKCDFLAVPDSFVKNKEDFKKSTIAAGSDVFFTGLFAPHPGDKVNTPIFRFGRVAMITDDRIRWQEASKAPEFVELYLLETMSFEGNSGLQFSSHKALIGCRTASL